MLEFPMIQRSFRTAALLLFVSLPALLPAQETTGIEEERMKALLARNAEMEQWFGPRNKITIGFRFLASGGRIDFGNLGAVPARFVEPASSGAVNRTYDNGFVNADSPRNEEIDASGNQITPQGGHYATFVTDADGVTEQNGDAVAYTPGRSRYWQANTDVQLTGRPGYVSLTNYSTTSEGAHFSDKPGPSAGVELQLNHDFGRISRRIQWGVTTGITLNGINGKSTGSVTATLNAHTDYYTALGPVEFLTAPAAGPTYNIYENPQSHNIYTLGQETTIPLSQLPVDSSESVTPGAATVNGRWQIKGAYFMVKMGPSFRTQFNDRLELTGSAGFAGAYAGTSYTATETFVVPGLLDGPSAGVSDPQVSTATKFLKGFYADLTLEWSANDTTALFGGLSAQQLSDYEQKVAERTARIDLGSTVGVRGGISIKF